MSFIYLPLPLEAVYEGWENKTPQYKELDVGGAKLLVEPMGMDRCRVVRLISTNPADYLKNEFQPGAEFQFTPQYTEDYQGQYLV